MEQETSPPANEKQIEALAKRIEALEGMICQMDADLHNAKMEISKHGSGIENILYTIGNAICDSLDAWEGIPSEESDDSEE